MMKRHARPAKVPCKKVVKKRGEKTTTTAKSAACERPLFLPLPLPHFRAHLPVLICWDFPLFEDVLTHQLIVIFRFVHLRDKRPSFFELLFLFFSTHSQFSLSLLYFALYKLAYILDTSVIHNNSNPERYIPASSRFLHRPCTN
uniref:Uncharacterized protein n=1 Tax=Trypanosoma vivax (strain Y486) TaxID=1055687 RepID=G0U8B1_TRYVY|nr:hypothetical protein, unlikely [Trypanosoma vivax Y486]